MACDLYDALELNGYSFFDGLKPYNINIVGVQSSREFTDKFDDELHLVYRDDRLNWQYDVWPITTQPGLYYLKNPMNPAGTGILVPDQYRGAYSLGLHQGKYEALCQVGPVRVYRDNDRDLEFDLIPETIEEGYFGVNIHRSNPYTESNLVGKWSALCQVFKRKKDFEQFMRIVRVSVSRYGQRVTYTLIERDDLEAVSSS